jgi:hypothetical protein
MTHSGADSAYEVVLGPAAVRAITGLPDGDREKMAAVLRTELMNGPNSRSEYRFDSEIQPYTGRAGSAVYTATPLSCDGYTAVHRLLSNAEVKRLRQEDGKSTADQGVYVIDILPVQSAFTRTVPRHAERRESGPG